MKFLQDKSVRERNRIAIIGTGTTAAILILVMLYIYSRPEYSTQGPEGKIVSAYATLLEKIQSLFSSK